MGCFQDGGWKDSYGENSRLGRLRMVGLEFTFVFSEVDEDGFSHRLDVMYHRDGDTVLVLEEGDEQVSADAWETIRTFLEKWQTVERGNGSREGG